MDILEILKMLRAIEPDHEYLKNSRRFIVGTPKQRMSPSLTLWQILAQSFQVGGTIVLAGLLLIMMFGGFSMGKFLTPFRISSLNPEGLRAEADAIDIQIQLTDLDYPQNQILLLSSETTTLPAVLKNVPPHKGKPSGLETGSSTEDSTIEDALQALSK